MMRLVGRFIDLAEAAHAAGAPPERIAAIGCMRALLRMGEEIADHELPRLADLGSRMERELGALALATGGSHAAHG